MPIPESEQLTSHTMATPGSPRRDEGFTLVELMVVVLIIGILIAIAIPVFGAASARVRQRTCYANQRTIEGTVQQYLAQTDGSTAAMLAGRFGSAHPLRNSYIHNQPPRCPAAPQPANPLDPQLTEGAYTLDASGTVLPCAFESHGHY